MPWITLLRLIGFSLAALTLISLSMSGNFRSNLAGIISSASVVWKMLALFVVIQVTTLAFSNQLGFSTQIVLINQIDCTLIFFAGCYVFSNKGSIFVWSYLMWASAVGVSLIGLIEQHEGRLPWAGHIPSFLKVNDPVISYILNGASREGMHRLQSTFAHPLIFAEYLTLAAPFVIHFAIAGRRPIIRLAAAASLPLLLYVVLSTLERLGVIGVILGSLTYLLFWAGLRWRRDRKSVFGPAVALAYPLIFTLAVVSTLFVHRLHAVVWGNGAENDSNAARAAQWASAIPKILRNPFGHGAGLGAAVLGNRELDGRLTIDSYYLSTVIEFGLVGFLLYYGVICYALFLCAKLLVTNGARDNEQDLFVPVASSIVVFLFTKSVLSASMNNPIIFALMAMVVAIAHQSGESRRVAMSNPSPVHSVLSAP